MKKSIKILLSTLIMVIIVGLISFWYIDNNYDWKRMVNKPKAEKITEDKPEYVVEPVVQEKDTIEISDITWEYSHGNTDKVTFNIKANKDVSYVEFNVTLEDKDGSILNSAYTNTVNILNENVRVIEAYIDHVEGAESCKIEVSELNLK